MKVGTAVTDITPAARSTILPAQWLRRVGECDRLFTIMGKSAIEKLSRACAILPVSYLAAATALPALAPPAARADEVMKDIGYGIIPGNERSCECLAAGVARR